MEVVVQAVEVDTQVAAEVEVAEVVHPLAADAQEDNKKGGFNHLF